MHTRVLRRRLGGTAAGLTLVLFPLFTSMRIDRASTRIDRALGVGGCAKGADAVDLSEGGSADDGAGLPVADGPSGSDTSTSGGTSGRDGEAPACTPKVVINELRVDDDEFVELYNASTCEIRLGDWEIKYQSDRGGAGGAGYRFAAADRVASKAYFLVAPANYPSQKDATLVEGMSATAGQIGLLDQKGVLVDGVAYGTVTAGDYGEKQTAPKPALGQSIGRSPNGADTGDNRADFRAATPSPRRSN